MTGLTIGAAALDGSDESDDVIINPYRFAAAGGGPPTLIATAFWDGLSQTIPAAAESGDLLIVFGSSTNRSELDITTGGWTEQYRFDMDANDIAGCWWKVSDGTETSVSSFSDSGNQEFILLVLRDAGAPVSHALGTFRTLDTPSIAVQEGDVLLGAVHGWFSGNTDYTAPPFYDVFDFERWELATGAIIAGASITSTGTDPGHTFVNETGGTICYPTAVVLR